MSARFIIYIVKGVFSQLMPLLDEAVKSTGTKSDDAALNILKAILGLDESEV